MSDLFPPFAPDPNEPRKRLFKPVPFRVIVPNIITLIALCLGLTAALMLYSFLLKDLKAIGWIAVLVFAIAMVLRLARFNVMLDDPHRPEWKKNFFTGMPAPAGALTSMLPLYLSFLGVSIGAAAAPIALVYL